MKFLLFGFGNPDNRGCEAIIRTVSKMIKHNFKNTRVFALSNDYGRVPMVSIETIDEYGYSYYPHPKKITTFMYYGMKKVVGSAAMLVHSQNLKSYLKYRDVDVVVSVGGDNYCYTTNMDYLIQPHKYFKKRGKKLIHWGSSFEEKLLNDSIISDLKQFDLIMVRESLSYDALIKHGLYGKVKLLPDPAFIMEPCEVNDFHIEKDTVGINISPLIYSFAHQKEKLSQSVAGLINYIIDEMKLKVALIPHVCDRRTGEGDFSVMQELLGRVNNIAACTIVGYGLSAPEYKYLISKCRFFVGARTHATIAAYSTYVPTLVIGYSVKAKGIAKDIFGEYENYVFPVQKIKHEDDLINAFKWLLEHENTIREHLTDFMPNYIKKAWQAGEEVQRLIEE